MTKEAPGSAVDVSALMAERKRYEEWIVTLEARKASTPPHVYERVRADYDVRLQAVLDKLSSHKGALEQQAQLLAGRLTSLQAEQQARRDERAELEVRAAVGELTAQDFADAIRKLDERLTQISSEQSTVSAELGRTREFLTAAVAPRQTPAAPAAVSPPPVKQPPPAATPMAAGSAQSDTPTRPPAPGPQPTQNFDELAFLNSVVSPAERARAQQLQQAAAQNDDVPIMRDEAATLGESLLARVNKPKPNDIVRQEPTDALSGARGKASETPLAANVTEQNPIVLRQGAESVAQGKTLKCAECGSMNYPTEWYCERCGAELASL
jgi:hypothetical protein